MIKKNKSNSYAVQYKRPINIDEGDIKKVVLSSEESYGK